MELIGQRRVSKGNRKFCTLGYPYGAPHGVKTENNHRLATSEKVVVAMESVGGIVNPHFRRCYFKRLEFDFYKNKKGQIIFVHETVVNA